MGSCRMIFIKVLLLLFLTAASIAQDEGSKSRFDKILQDFGFSGIGADRSKAIPEVKVESRPAQKSSQRPASISRNSSAKRNRDFDVQSNTIPGAQTNSRPNKGVKSSAALAALFSVAGRPNNSENSNKSAKPANTRNRPKSKSPVVKVLN